MTGPGARGTGSYRWWVLGVTSLGALLASLNMSTLVIALPQLLRSLHTGLIEVVWVLLSYLLAQTALVLSAGRLGDLYGRKRLYAAGFALFTVMALASGFAGMPLLLIGLRVLAGCGGALMLASSGAIVTDAFPRRELGLALGINAMVIAVGAAVGPVLGGWLTSFGWQWVFWFNVPLGVLGTIASVIVLRDSTAPRRPRRLARQPGVPGRDDRSARRAVDGWHRGLDAPRRRRGRRRVRRRHATVLPPAAHRARPAARPHAVPQPALRHRQPHPVPQRARPNGPPLPAGVLLPGPRGEGPDHCRRARPAAADRHVRLLPHLRLDERPHRLPAAGARRGRAHRRGPARDGGDAERRRHLSAARRVAGDHRRRRRPVQLAQRQLDHGVGQRGPARHRVGRAHASRPRRQHDLDRVCARDRDLEPPQGSDAADLLRAG